MALIRNKEQLVRNGGSALNRKARRLCLQALESALLAADPYRALRSQVKIRNDRLVLNHYEISLSDIRKIMLLAVGKASVSMMRAALQILRDFHPYGILVAPKKQRIPTFADRIEVVRAGHPLPDRDGLSAARKVEAAVSRMGEKELLICLISGGASAMLPAPALGISLEDKRKVTEELVRSKATIHEINTVRRHLSRLKGGRLVELCPASKILSLIVSDVPGNPLPDIASGLTVEDPTTYRDAIGVLQRHNLWDHIPTQVRTHVTKGVRGDMPDTPKPGASAFRKVRNIIIADNGVACAAAKKALLANKIPAIILSTSAEMEARSMGRLLASIATRTKRYGEPLPHLGGLVIGGETTVEVKGRGIGGRNQETALSAVTDIRSLRGVAIAALGTDGIDGNSTAAGAIIDGNTAERAYDKRMNPVDFLERNDSYRFFRPLGDNIFTGRTGTNVGDLYLMVAAT